MSFLPDNYEAPPSSGGNYFKPPSGESRVRVVGSAVVGWVGWDKSGQKPVPKRAKAREEVAHLDAQDDGVKFFWAFPVIDRASGDVQIWEVTQMTIQKAIEGLTKDADYGDPHGYDLKILKTGSGKETSYHLTPAPPAPADITEANRAVLANLDMSQLITGGDPFGDS